MKDMSRARMVGVWFAVVAVTAAFGVAMGMNISGSTGALLAVMSVVPPVVMLLVWRGAPPDTVAEVLHNADASKGGR